MEPSKHAGRITGDELGRSWKQREVVTRGESDAENLEIEVRVLQETTLSLKKTAERLQLETARSTNVRLHNAMEERTRPVPAQVCHHNEYTL